MLLADAKLGVLVASAFAGTTALILGYWSPKPAPRATPTVWARQVSYTNIDAASWAVK